MRCRDNDERIKKEGKQFSSGQVHHETIVGTCDFPVCVHFLSFYILLFFGSADNEEASRTETVSECLEPALDLLLECN